MLPITYLFVPADRTERIDKALACGADAVIVDLEDTVAPGAKPNARSALAGWCAARSVAHADALERLIVRINDAATPWFSDDLEVVRQAGLRGVMLPKTESAEQVVAVMTVLSIGFVVALVETARGVLNAESIAAANGVQRLAFGTLDFALDLDLSGDDRGLLYAASRIATASRAAGIAAPIAGVTTAIDDEARLLADVACARACGFGAKLCIHPRQVGAVRRAFMPADADIDWAQRVIAAMQPGHGAVLLDGKLVDRPVLLRAQAILARAGKKPGN